MIVSEDIDKYIGSVVKVVAAPAVVVGPLSKSALCIYSAEIVCGLDVEVRQLKAEVSFHIGDIISITPAKPPTLPIPVIVIR